MLFSILIRIKNRIMLLIRLIRIIKLYKYVVKSGSEMEEARMREQ